MTEKDLKLIFWSHGLKRRTPFPRADCYIDCRGVREPDGIVGELSKAQKLVAADLDIKPYIEIIKHHISRLPTRRAHMKDPYTRPFTIVCFCAWGVNRSPAMKMLLAAAFREMGYAVEVVMKKYSDPFVAAMQPAAGVVSFMSTAGPLVAGLSDEEFSELESAVDARKDTEDEKAAAKIRLSGDELRLLGEEIMEGSKSCAKTVSRVISNHQCTWRAAQKAVWREADKIEAELTKKAN